MDIYTASETAYKNGYEAGVKEFAERLKGYTKELKIGDNIYLQVVGIGRIDNLAKELTESKNDFEEETK